MFAGRSVDSDWLFAPVHIGEVEVSCYDYIILYIILFLVLLENPNIKLEF